MVEMNTLKPGIEMPFQESPREFLVLAFEVARSLNWGIYDVCRQGFIARVPATPGRQPVTLKLHIADQVAHIATNRPEDYMPDEQDLHDDPAARFAEGIYSVRYYFTPEEIELKYLQLERFFPENAAVPIDKQPEVAAPTVNDLRLGDYATTIGIAAVNILVFALMVLMGGDILEPSTTMMMDWGANYGPSTLNGQWWRIISACFLHFGIVHLLANMYALAYIGLLLEPYLGRVRFGMAYLITGIAGSLASVWWHGFSVSAGASGAVFGMYGVMLALLTTNYLEKKVRKPMLVSIAFFVVYNLSAGMKEGIDNAAHLGGLLMGILMGYAYVYSLKKPYAPKLKYLSTMILVVAALALSAFAYKNIPNPAGVYNQEMQIFRTNEQQALQDYSRMHTNVSVAERKALLDKGTVLWKENLTILNNLDKLNLRGHVGDKNAQLKDYVQLRLQAHELSYVAITEHTDRYNERLQQLSTLIAAQLELMADSK